MSDIISILLYALSWFFLFVVYYKKNKTIGIAGSIMLVYGCFALTSIYFYYNVPDNREINNVTLPPFIYLFCCIYICIRPLIKYNQYISKYPLRIHPEIFNYIKIILILISPLILLCFIELMVLSYKSNAISLADAYNSSTFSLSSYLSKPALLGYTIAHWGAYIWPMLFFYSLIVGSKKCSMIAILAYCIEILQGYVSGDRVTLVRFMLYLGITYYLLNEYINNSIKKKIKLISLFIGGFLILGLFLITIGRFIYHDGDIDIGGFISLYSGEGCIRFSQYIWGLEKTSDGDTCFSLLKDLLGFDTFTDNFHRRYYYERYFNIPTFIFYTFIGDFFQDFGLIGTIIICCMLAFIVSSIINKMIRRRIANCLSIFLISIILQIYFFGFMYYNFKTYNDQLQLIAPLLFWFIIDFIEKQKLRKY